MEVASGCPASRLLGSSAFQAERIVARWRRVEQFLTSSRRTETRTGGAGGKERWWGGARRTGSPIDGPQLSTQSTRWYEGGTAAVKSACVLR